MKVNVKAKIDHVEWTPASIDAEEGSPPVDAGVVAIRPNGNPANPQPAWVFASSNPAVADVDPVSGVVTIGDPGTAEISATDPATGKVWE